MTEEQKQEVETLVDTVKYNLKEIESFVVEIDKILKDLQNLISPNETKDF